MNLIFGIMILAASLFAPKPQTKLVAVGAVPAHGTMVVSFQWDTPFPDANYATGISIASNAGDATHPPVGLHLDQAIRRPDGMDLTLSNPQDTDQASDSISIWAGY